MGEAAHAVQDTDYGIEAWLGGPQGIGGRLKQRYEDFVVDELGPPPPVVAQGTLTAARVRLTNWETNRFAREASQVLGMSRRGVHFSGNKDKRAVTTQWFTFRAAEAAVKALGRIPGVEILSTHRTDKERALGDHTGNAFRITVRRLEASEEAARSRIQAVLAAAEEAGGFPNFYGPQRFGTARATTHLVGRHIVHGRFQEAIDAYVATPAPDDEAAVAAARQAYIVDRDAARLLKALEPTGADFERALLNPLVRNPGAPERAFAGLPANLQTLFVFAYQSFLFNRMLSARMRSGLSLAQPVAGDLVAVMEAGNPGDEWLPVTEMNLQRCRTEAARSRLAPTALLVGSEAPFAAAEPGLIERRVLEEDGIRPNHFIVPEVPTLSSKGSRRPVAVRAQGLAARVEGDDRNPGHAKAVFDFSLPKGAYATVILREFLGLAEPAAYA